MVDGEATVNTTQPALAMNLPPTISSGRVCWTCADCWPVTQGNAGLGWLPPDYKRGRCARCGRVYEFESRYGEDELVEELGE